MPDIAIVGSGPAGYYAAEAAYKTWGADARVDMIDRLPVPYGLIRSGVAPDHQSIKAVANRYQATAQAGNMRFCGNIEVGRDIAINDLAHCYDAVVLATGAPRDRPLAIPGDTCGNVFGSAAFVGWYNGHPDFVGLDPDLSGGTAVVIGMGNVALDVARILAKTAPEFSGSDIVDHALGRIDAARLDRIIILGRRGPHQIMMTPKELGELGHLARARPHVDPMDLPAIETDSALEPGQRKAVAQLRNFATSVETGATERLPIDFVFHATPHALIPDQAGKVCAIEVEATVMDHGSPVGTGKIRRIPASLVISCIGFRTTPIAGVAYDERGGHFANLDGLIAPGLYCVGWARRGPSGTIGTNRPDGFGVIERIAADLRATGSETPAKPGRDGLDALIRSKQLNPVSFDDWKRIEAAEIERARPGAPREKFVVISDMIAASDNKPTGA